MKTLAQSALAAFFACLVVSISAQAQNTSSNGPERVTPGVFLGDLRDLPVVPPGDPGAPVRDIPRRITHPENLLPPPPPVNPTTWVRDPLLKLQEAVTVTAAPRAFATPNLNFAGQGYTTAVVPDTVGDVGPTYYIQMVNDCPGGSQVTIYDKSDGSVATGPFVLESLSAGGVCTSGFGDPIVLYDPLAERWLMSEFSSVANALCVYISITNDPISGGWYGYSFITPNFPDYPKYAVWPDAYYVSANEPGAPAAYALDRINMLAGVPALPPIRHVAPSLNGFSFQALVPSDLDGSTPPPAGAPNYFIRHRDDEVHNPGSNDPTKDFLDIWEFHADFATPNDSTFGIAVGLPPVNTPTISIPIAEIDSNLCGLFGCACFPQLGSPVTLDPLREVVMWRLQYRNFETHESLVGNLVTDIDGTDHGGVRWFELRKSGGGPWALYQEGTYAPDSHSRWMGSVAMDGEGNIALGYSISSETIYPGIRYTGRRVDDPLGTMPQGEVTVVAGEVASSFNRWGDYSSMNVDPVDDCTFWYTNEYADEKGTWATQIASFVFNSCLGVDPPDPPDPPGELAIGACCIEQNSVCLDFQNECQCADANGLFVGDGTTCDTALICTGPIVEILTPEEGDSFPEFSDILITVDAYDVNKDGFVEQVEFLVDNTLAGVDADGKDGWSQLLENVAAGDFLLEVIATDNDGLTGTASLLLRVECPTPMDTSDSTHDCTGTVDCRLAALPFGPPSLTRVNPTEFDFGNTGLTCFPTVGRTLAATALKLNSITEAQLFTDLPAVEILGFGLVQSFPLQGCALHAGATVCLPGIAEALAVTDRVMATVSGGISVDHVFPNNSLPLSAAGIATCAGCGNTFTFAVETSANTIETVSGAVVTSFPFSEPINDRPISFTNGSLSGILAFTDTDSHTISGGVDNIVALNGRYIGNRIGPDGVTVFTTGDGTCFPTAGTILGATVAGAGIIKESIVFTDAPSIEVFSGGVQTAFGLTGTRMLCGGSDCVFNLAESTAITDRAISTVTGGVLTESLFPKGVEPVSAAGIGVCSIGNSYTLCVELDSNNIRCVSGGIVDDYPIPVPLAARPVSVTNGTESGVIVFTNSTAYVIAGGVITPTELPGDFILYTPTGAGVSVFTTGGIILIPSPPQSTFRNFGRCDGETGAAISYNLSLCPAIGGVNAGWNPPGVTCVGGVASTLPGGPFNPAPTCGPGGCGGTVRLPLADFPFDQGTAHTVTEPNALVVGGLLLAIGPNASILPFANCTEPLKACAATANITMNIAPCPDIDAANASWPPNDVECHWGACCLPGGQCIDRVTVECCQDSQGTYLGDNSECDPVGCCFPDGSCNFLDPRCCVIEGGTPQPAACAPRRCCFPDDTCRTIDPQCCLLLGGVPRNGACVAERGCCFADLSCRMLDPVCCGVLGGTPIAENCSDETGCCIDGGCMPADPACCEHAGGVVGDGACGVETGCCRGDDCSNEDKACCEKTGGEDVGACLGDANGDDKDDACVEVMPPVRAPEPHDIRKNRYISIDPRGVDGINPPNLHIRVMVDSADVNGLTGSGPWWANAPDADCISYVTTTKPAAEPDWSGCPTVHLTGCPIVPTTIYGIAAESGGELSAENLLDTQAKPGIKWTGDVVGAFTGTEWTGPNGQTNIDDAVAAIKTFQKPDNLPGCDDPPCNATHTSVTDVAPNLTPGPPNNKIVNIEDVLIIIIGFGGAEYPGKDLTQCE